MPVCLAVEKLNAVLPAGCAWARWAAPQGVGLDCYRKCHRALIKDAETTGDELSTIGRFSGAGIRLDEKMRMMEDHRVTSGADSLLQLVEAAKAYDLGQPMEPGMPVSPNHPGFHMALVHRHGDMVLPDDISGATEILVMGGHVGTHIDALAHISHQGKLYGGLDAYEAQVGGRFQELGIDQAGVILCRGILLDVAKLHGVPVLASGTGIGAGDLRRAAHQAGVKPRRGDAILVRSGWAANWGDPTKYVGHESGVPGVDASGAELIARWGARVTGLDSMAYEQIPPQPGSPRLTVHRILLVEHGIYILENLNLDHLAEDQVYEFLFVASPLKLVGATGSPVRPIAVVFQ